MRTMIHDGVSEQQIERHARLSTPSIRDDGLARVLRGETTLEESPARHHARTDGSASAAANLRWVPSSTPR